MSAFLFWRAMLLIGSTKDMCSSKPKMLFSEKKSDHVPSSKEVPNATQTPVEIKFGRPNFKEIFQESLTENQKESHVYA
jgi:hypothetical protein